MIVTIRKSRIKERFSPANCHSRNVTIHPYDNQNVTPPRIPENRVFRSTKKPRDLIRLLLTGGRVYLISPVKSFKCTFDTQVT